MLWSRVVGILHGLQLPVSIISKLQSPRKRRSSDPKTAKSRGIFRVLLVRGRASLIAQLVKNPPATQETPVRFLGQEDPLEKGQATHTSILGLPRWLQLVKNLPAMQDTWVHCLDWEDPLEKGQASHSSILAWRIPWSV